VISTAIQFKKDFSKCDISDQLSLYGDVENQCVLQANVFL